MNSPVLARLFAAAGLVSLCAAGCGGGVSDELAATFSMTCVDGTGTVTGNATTTTLERCMYYRASKQLAVNFEGEDAAIDVDLFDFTGVGTYNTGASEADSNTIYFSAGLAHGGTWAYGDVAPVGCTVEVTDTNLNEVEIPAYFSSHGYLVLDITCAKVGGNGEVGYPSCTVSPSTFHFSVAACEAASE